MIIAYTLEAEFDPVFQALKQCGPDNSGNEERLSSVLTDLEEENVWQIAIIIADMHEKCMSNHWNLTQDCDRDDSQHCDKADQRPRDSRRVHTRNACNLRRVCLFSTTCVCAGRSNLLTCFRHRCDPMKRHYTILSRYINDRKELDTALPAHARVIETISPNESVRHVLGNAFKTWQEQMGIKYVDSWEVNLSKYSLPGQRMFRIIADKLH